MEIWFRRRNRQYKISHLSSMIVTSLEGEQLVLLVGGGLISIQAYFLTCYSSHLTSLSHTKTLQVEPILFENEKFLNFSSSCRGHRVWWMCIMLENDQKQACCYLKGQARCQWPICRPRRQPRSTEGFWRPPQLGAPSGLHFWNHHFHSGRKLAGIGRQWRGLWFKGVSFWSAKVERKFSAK